MPRFILQVGCQHYVISNKNGLGALTELLLEAMPVTARIYRDPPEIELTYAEDPEMLEVLQKVVVVRIPPGVVWKQKTKNGEVQVVRPVEKAPRALKAPKQKALPAPKRPALPAPNPQLALL